MISAMIQFATHGIWEIRLKDLSPVRAFLVKDLRVLVLALRGFFRDKCLLRASALTSYSLLSIVPLFALVFGIAKGFGLETFIQHQIVELAERANWPPHLVERWVLFAGRLLETRPTVKVLFTSGYTAEAISHQEVLDAGAAYLPKPFTASQLALKIREILGAR